MDRSVVAFAVVVLTSLACTRLNPAFDADSQAAGSSDELDGASSSEAADESEATSASGSSASESSASESESGVVVMDMAEDPACAVGHPFGLHITTPFATDPPMCPGELAPTGFLVEKDGGLMLNVCTLGCGACGDTYYPIAIDFDLSPLLGKCVTIEAENPVLDGDWCSYEALSVFDGVVPGVPYLVAANRLAPTGSAIAMLGGWPQLLVEQNMLVVDATCTCNEAGLDEACCMGEQTFTNYSFAYQGMTVDVGQSAYVDVESSDYEYEFYVAMAQQRAGCTMVPELAWKLFAVGL